MKSWEPRFLEEFEEAEVAPPIVMTDKKRAGCRQGNLMRFFPAPKRFWKSKCAARDERRRFAVPIGLLDKVTF